MTVSYSTFSTDARVTSWETWHFDPSWSINHQHLRKILCHLLSVKLKKAFLTDEEAGVSVADAALWLHNSCSVLLFRLISTGISLDSHLLSLHLLCPQPCDHIGAINNDKKKTSLMWSYNKVPRLIIKGSNASHQDLVEEFRTNFLSFTFCLLLIKKPLCLFKKL